MSFVYLGGAKIIIAAERRFRLVGQTVSAEFDLVEGGAVVVISTISFLAQTSTEQVKMMTFLLNRLTHRRLWMQKHSGSRLDLEQKWGANQVEPEAGKWPTLADQLGEC